MPPRRESMDSVIEHELPSPRPKQLHQAERHRTTKKKACCSRRLASSKSLIYAYRSTFLRELNTLSALFRDWRLLYGLRNPWQTQTKPPPLIPSPPAYGFPNS